MTTRVWPRMTLGIDVGGTKIRSTLLSEKGHILFSNVIPTKKEALQHSLQTLISSYEKRGKLAGIGIALAGQVDSKEGRLLFAPNLSLRNQPISSWCSEVSSSPVILMNDVFAAAACEKEIGSALGVKNGLFVFLGTGIGGAIIAEGKLYKGHLGTAGEIGHISVNYEGPVCSCGSKGCVEVYSSGWGLAKRGGFPDGRTAFQEGSEELVQEGFIALASCLGGLVNTLNPEKIILGGGLLQGYVNRINDFYRALLEEIKKRALPRASQELVLVQAHFQEEAASIGAALLARQKSSAFDVPA